MLDLRRLTILHQFSVTGSITATADALGYSPSAISQQLTTLERETGAVLLERTARSASLTDAGRLLARRARDLIAAAEQTESDLAEQLGQVSGSLIVTTIPSLAAPVATAVVTVQQEHPGVEIVMRQTAARGVTAAVAEHDVDIAVTDDWGARPARAPEGLSRRHISTEPVVLVVDAGHPLAGLDRPLPARELAAAVAEMTWLCSPQGHPSRVAGDRRLEEIGAKPRVRWEFEGLGTVAELVASGTGCALLPESVARTQPADRVHLLRLTPGMSRHLYTLTRRSKSASPSVAVVLAAIHDQLAAD